MDFGLGLVLSFTDNATSGINSAVNSLNQLTNTAESANASLTEIASLSAFSSIATNVGNSMTSAGASILSTFSNVISKVNETGQTLMYAENAFDTLYRDSEKTGADVLADIQAYAETSIFAFEDLIPVVRMLKANGIEAFDAITTSSGKTTQTLMDYASDLAAFNPQMRNAYGTGVQAAMGALNEYIAEGNKRLLKSGASLDITSLLGEDVGSTIEERSQQVADLLEQLNMVGMTASMAGTPMQILSNMEDVLFNTLGKIANMGVYDEFTKIVSALGEFVFGLEQSGKLDQIAQTVADALVTLMKPIEKLVGWLIKLGNGFADLVANNPALAKFATIGTAIAGVLLVVGGVILKVAGTFGYLTLMIKQLSGSMSAIGTVMKAGATKILGALLPLTLALGLMYIVWKNDLFGIRTSITQFVQNVVKSFQTAKSAVSGSLADIQNVLKQYDSSHSFFDGLTLAITRVMVLAKALSEGWNDYTLSEDTYLKAKELGILPLIEAIFDLKYRFDNFKAGFIQGWQDISDKVQAFFQGLGDKVDGTIFETLLDNVTSFFQSLSNNDADAWYQFGYSFAEFTAKALAFTVAIKALTKIIGVVTKVAKVISTLFNGIVKVVEFAMGLPSKIASVFSSVVGVVSKAISDIIGFFQLVSEYGLAETMEGLFGTATTVASGIVSAVGGAIMAVVSFVSQWKNGFSVIKAIILTIGSLLVALGLVILGVCGGWIPFVVALVVAGLAELVILVKDHWEQIKTVIGNIASWVNQHIIQPILNFFSPVINLIKQMWESFAQTVQHVVERIKTFIGELIAGVKSIWDNIMSYISPAIETFKELASTFGEFCSFIGGKIADLWTGKIQPVLTAIGNFFVSVFNKILSVVTTVWNAIWNVISPVVMAIWNTIQSVFTSIFDTIMNVLSAIWQGIVGVINGIVTFIGSILNGIWQTIANVLMGIMNTIMGKNAEAKQNFTNAWNAIKSIFTGALQGILQIATSIMNMIVNVFTSIWNGIKGIWTSAVNGVKNIFSSVFNGIKSLATSIMSAISGAISNAWNGIKNTVSNVVNGIKTVVSNGFNAMKSTVTSIGSGISSAVSTVFNGIKNTISNVINGAKTVVSNGLNAIKNFFSNCHLSLPSIKLPHFSITGSLSINPPSVPHLSVSWYKQGGVFNEPSVIGVGENGQEAVMPLENNTEWIGTLANMITSKMNGTNLTPTNSGMIASDSSSSGDNSYLATHGQTTNDNSTVDNSITFSAGAIQITAQNSSDEEAEKLAKKIMEYIKRQQQLNGMLAYSN